MLFNLSIRKLNIISQSIEEGIRIMWARYITTTIFEKPIIDQWIHAELNLPQEEMLRKAKVVCQTKDNNGDAMGSNDPNSFLNTLTYDVEFSDGEIKERSSNVTAENMHSQADEDSQNMKTLDSVANCRKERNTVDKAGMCLSTKNGKKCLRHTPSGLSLLIIWKNGEK